MRGPDRDRTLEGKPAQSITIQPTSTAKRTANRQDGVHSLRHFWYNIPNL